MGEFPHTFSAEEQQAGRATQRRLREERRQRLEAVLDAKLEALGCALLEEALDAPLGQRTVAIKEAIHQLAGRPAQIVMGDEDAPPVTIIVQSIRREPS